MGCCSSGQNQMSQGVTSKKTTLTVATLNYCGIMNSPFEFYCEQYKSQLRDISNIFYSLIPKYIPTFDKQKFKWEMGKIDLKIRVGRYSPMFKAQVGIEDNKFLDRAQFEKKWDEVFEIQRKKANLECKDSQIQATKLYDVIAYHTMLKYVFKVESIQEALGKDPQVYLKSQRPFYQLSFLNEQRKVKKMVDNFSKLASDVFFFQQYSQFFYNYLNDRNQHFISVDSTKDTMIIAKKSSFTQRKDADQVLSKLSKEQRDNLNWGERSAFLILDNYIFIAAHLSSKAQKNKPQIESLKKGLPDLRALLPQYEIVVGGDLNSFLQPFSNDFKIYPQHADKLTTIKKRTMTQGQFNKAQKVVEQSKDKIISTLEIQNGRIAYINGSVPAKDNYVPTNEHPFDHFVLVATIHRQASR